MMNKQSTYPAAPFSGVHDTVTFDQRAVASGVQVLRREQAIAPAAIQKKRVAAYCRVSTDMEQQATSLDTQMKAFNEMIAAHADWELAGIYADEGLSGTRAANRIQFQRMIEDCEAGKINLILTKSISRFARNTTDCLLYVRKLKDLGIYVYFDENHFDTSSTSSEMLLTILAAVAQEESHSISENLKIGMRMRFKAGKPKWVNVYGYMKGKNDEYLINEEQARGVRRMFELCVAGYSLPQIAATLDAENIPTKYGGCWRTKSLSAMLHNEKYVGDVMMQKTYTVDHLSHRQAKNDQTVVPSYYVKDHHEAIVDRQTFERAQTILRMKDRHQGYVQYPYYGTLICPFCGAKMVAFSLPFVGHFQAWTCGGHSDDGASTEHGEQQTVKKNCPAYVIQAKYIDRALREAFRHLDMAALEDTAAKGGKRGTAAKAALRWKKEAPTLKRIEYLFLDETVERITFSKWSEAVITWKFGGSSRIPVQYEKVSEIPNVELKQTKEGYMLDGNVVRSGHQVQQRLDTVRETCLKVRAGGQRPSAGRGATH
jgi:DNA invertase Pin-like site-specific DNA recombinase